MSTNSEILVEVTRGGIAESVHRGSIAVTDVDGRVVMGSGNPYVLTSMRSCAKPLQAMCVMLSGACEKFVFDDREIALFCGSLNGQDFQVDAVRSVLKKIGLSEENLKCGVHYPSHRQTANLLRAENIKPGAVHNNCAGKHAAMLALCVYNGWSVEDYEKPEHPVQKLVLNMIAEMTGERKEDIQMAVDGCGVPVFFTPLKSLARSYSLLSKAFEYDQTGTVFERAVNRLMTASLDYPEMIAGDGRICTETIRICGRKIFAKTGAEGGYAMALFDKKYGVAIKIDDGSQRAYGPVIVEILNQLNVLEPLEKEKLQNYHRPLVKNHRGDSVGEVRAVFTLR